MVTLDRCKELHLQPLRLIMVVSSITKRLADACVPLLTTHFVLIVGFGIYITYRGEEIVFQVRRAIR